MKRNRSNALKDQKTTTTSRAKKEDDIGDEDPRILVPAGVRKCVLYAILLVFLFSWLPLVRGTGTFSKEDIEIPDTINLFDAEVRGVRILARDNTNKMAIFNEGVLNRL